MLVLQLSGKKFKGLRASGFGLRLCLEPYAVHSTNIQGDYGIGNENNIFAIIPSHHSSHNSTMLTSSLSFGVGGRSETSVQRTR